jgi:hypothetical protein
LRKAGNGGIPALRPPTAKAMICLYHQNIIIQMSSPFRGRCVCGAGLRMHSGARYFTLTLSLSRQGRGDVQAAPRANRNSAMVTERPQQLSLSPRLRGVRPGVRGELRRCSRFNYHPHPVPLPSRERGRAGGTACKKEPCHGNRKVVSPLPLRPIAGGEARGEGGIEAV